MTQGRKTTYTTKKAKAICDALASSSISVRELALQDDMPCEVTIYKWLNQNEDFAKKYAHAKKSQMDYMAEEIIDISDNAANDYMLRQGRSDDKESGYVTNGEAIQRSKLRVDSRKWLMSKLNAKKYGDKTQLTGADGEGPVEVSQIVRTIVDPKKKGK